MICSGRRGSERGVLRAGSSSPKRTGGRLVGFLVLGVVVACGSSARGHGRKVPVCAVQDCATGRMIDDGCVERWLGTKDCLACVNFCQSAAIPSSAEPTGVVTAPTAASAPQ
jgi:hypothetical protein